MACDPVGTKEVADRLGVEPATVRMWRHRSKTGDLPPPPFPEPRWTVSGGPCWNWPDIERWARDTGRLPSPDMRR